MTIVVIEGGIVQNVYGDDVIVVDRDQDNEEEEWAVYSMEPTAGVEGFCADIDMEEPELCVRVRDMMGRPPGV